MWLPRPFYPEWTVSLIDFNTAVAEAVLHRFTQNAGKFKEIHCVNPYFLFVYPLPFHLVLKIAQTDAIPLADSPFLPNIQPENRVRDDM